MKIDDFKKIFETNIKNAKQRKTDEEKEEAVFYNLNIKSDGSEIIFYAEDGYIYTLNKKEIDEIDNDSKTKCIIQKLVEYSNHKITFEELINIK